VFQSPISGVNDWNGGDMDRRIPDDECFSLLSAELMIGTNEGIKETCDTTLKFQSPISGVNDWNLDSNAVLSVVAAKFQSPISGVNDWNLENLSGLKTLPLVSVSYQRS